MALLTSKFCQAIITIYLNSRAYAAAGQACDSLHTMKVLQAYQVDPLKDLNQGQGLSGRRSQRDAAPWIWLFNGSDGGHGEASVVELGRHQGGEFRGGGNILNASVSF